MVKWLEEAKKDIGTTEIKGPATNSTIKKWLQNLNAWWSDDETPWCGVAVAEWMHRSNVNYPKNYMRAKAWLDWGTEIKDPVEGCVVIFSRAGGGHVGLVTKLGKDGRLCVLGGNQGDKVCEEWFDKDRVLGYRLPTTYTAQMMSTASNLAVVSNEGAKSSTNEA